MFRVWLEELLPATPKEWWIDIFSLSDPAEEEISLKSYPLSIAARDSPDENSPLSPDSSLSSPIYHFPKQTAEQSMIHIEDFNHSTYRGRYTIHTWLYSS